MKLAIRTVFFHFLCILLFAIFYYNFQDHYYHNVQELRETFLDYFLLRFSLVRADFLLVCPTKRRSLKG